MQDIIAYTLASWLVLGLLSAAIILLNQINHGERNLLWPVIGLLLNFIGMLLFFLFVMRKRKKVESYPAKPQYEAPSYKYEKKEEAPAAEPEKKNVKQLEGAPRCESCGAAVSAHDLKCPKCGKPLK
jgi:heme/copper-type cytochrome/quinol oxidase subunit 2